MGCERQRLRRRRTQATPQRRTRRGGTRPLRRRQKARGAWSPTTRPRRRSCGGRAVQARRKSRAWGTWAAHRQVLVARCACLPAPRCRRWRGARRCRSSGLPALTALPRVPRRLRSTSQVRACLRLGPSSSRTRAWGCFLTWRTCVLRSPLKPEQTLTRMPRPPARTHAVPRQGRRRPRCRARAAAPHVPHRRQWGTPLQGAGGRSWGKLKMPSTVAVCRAIARA